MALTKIYFGRREFILIPRLLRKRFKKKNLKLVSKFAKSETMNENLTKAQYNKHKQKCYVLLEIYELYLHENLTNVSANNMNKIIQYFVMIEICEMELQQ